MPRKEPRAHPTLSCLLCSRTTKQMGEFLVSEPGPVLSAGLYRFMLCEKHSQSMRADSAALRWRITKALVDRQKQLDAVRLN